MKRYGIVYKITCMKDNKVYIGQTKNTFNRRYDNGGVGIERVYNHYMGNIRNNRSYNEHLMSAMLKYGFDCFEIIEEFDVAFSHEELNQKEKHWIDYYKSSHSEHGYNRETGGNRNKIIKEETRLKQSIKQKLRFSNPENKAYLHTRVCSEETRYKISQSKIGKTGQPMSKEKLQLLNESKKRSIICKTTGEIFEYMKDALEKYNIKSQGNLCMACQGKRKYCGKLNNTTPLEWEYYGTV